MAASRRSVNNITLQLRVELLDEIIRQGLAADSQITSLISKAAEIVRKAHASVFEGDIDDPDHLRSDDALRLAQEMLRGDLLEAKKNPATITQSLQELKNKYEFDQVLCLVDQIQKTYADIEGKRAFNAGLLSEMEKEISEINNSPPTEMNYNQKLIAAVRTLAEYFTSQKTSYQESARTALTDKLFSKPKGFIKYLNEDEASHHFSRLVGVALKDVLARNLGGCKDKIKGDNIELVAKIDQLKTPDAPGYSEMKTQPLLPEKTRPRRGPRMDRRSEE